MTPPHPEREVDASVIEAAPCTATEHRCIALALAFFAAMAAVKQTDGLWQSAVAGCLANQAGSE